MFVNVLLTVTFFTRRALQTHHYAYRKRSSYLFISSRAKQEGWQVCPQPSSVCCSTSCLVLYFMSLSFISCLLSNFLSVSSTLCLAFSFRSASCSTLTHWLTTCSPIFTSPRSLWAGGPDRRDHLRCKLPGLHPASVREKSLQEHPHDAGPGGCEQGQGTHAHTNTHMHIFTRHTNTHTPTHKQSQNSHTPTNKHKTHTHTHTKTTQRTDQHEGKVATVVSI